MLFEKERLQEYWLAMRQDPDFADRLNQVRAAYESIKGIGELTYTLKKIYSKTGSRDEYEEPHLIRRDLMHSAGILALAYPEEQKYLDSFQDAVWALCEEESWMLPQDDGDLIFRGDYIELVSALTGGAIAELLWFLGNRTDENIREAAGRQLKRQIIDPYLRHRFFWETAKHNWAGVCGCGVGAVLMYQDPEEFIRQQDRLISTMDCCLEGYSEDGTCNEGIGYWEYGFGHFTAFAHLLKQFSNGKINLFDRSVVPNAAGFGPRQYLQGDCTVSYADGERDKHIYGGLAEYLHSVFPQEVPLLPRSRKSYGFVRHWFTFRLEFLAFVPDCSGPIELKDYYMKNGGQFIVNRPGYSLSAKAGHNDETHNHNDIGSFIVAPAAGGGQVLCDTGVGCYTRSYFTPDTRYSIFCNSSLGHSVPIIDGTCQKEGREYCGTMSFYGTCCDIHMEKAYPLPELRSLVRHMEWTDDTIFITDTYVGEIKQITERLTALAEPVVSENKIALGNIILEWGSWTDGPVITSTLHKRRAPVGSTDKIYIIDFPVKTGILKTEIRLTIG